LFSFFFYTIRWDLKFLAFQPSCRLPRHRSLPTVSLRQPEVPSQAPNRSNVIFEAPLFVTKNPFHSRGISHHTLSGSCLTYFFSPPPTAYYWTPVPQPLIFFLTSPPFTQCRLPVALAPFCKTLTRSYPPSVDPPRLFAPPGDPSPPLYHFFFFYLRGSSAHFATLDSPKFLVLDFRACRPPSVPNAVLSSFLPHTLRALSSWVPFPGRRKLLPTSLPI